MRASGRAHAPAQTTSSDPDRAVAVLEAHLGERLTAWQAYVVIAMLTPRRLWGEYVLGEPLPDLTNPRAGT